MSQLPNNKENILGIDYGLVNTGIAICDNGIVSPLTIINSKNFNHLQSSLSTLVVKNKINKIVVGLPLSANGSENPQTLKVRQFVNNLKKYIKIPIVFINEYGSTQEFLSSGVVSNVSRKKVKNNDMYSAALIIEYYLESLN
jgi:putative Holliday junction resolvase